VLRVLSEDGEAQDDLPLRCGSDVDAMGEPLAAEMRDFLDD
jgi:hypothetical protein